VLVPSPGYPVYSIATLLAGGTPYFMPLKEENDFLPELDLIPDDVMRQVKLIFINYPNNPTAGCAKDEFFEKVIYYAKRYEILVCHDAAYSEVTFDGYKPKSIIEFDKEKRYSIEFHSLSKTYCMTGWRIGFAIGNKDGINNLGKLKTNIDSGVFQAIQIAGIEAMMGDQSEISEMNDRLKKRRDLIVDGLIDIGIAVKRPKATYYIWAKVPEGYTSSDFCERLIEETGVVVTPGIGFGDYGEGYFRISITTKEERIREAIKRLKDVCAK
jgi:LL-diaminopimelate aminotransferase